MSHVTCHVSHVTCHVSHVICHFFFFLFFGQSGQAYWWKVCYQQGLPRLVYISQHQTNYKTRLVGNRSNWSVFIVAAHRWTFGWNFDWHRSWPSEVWHLQSALGNPGVEVWRGLAPILLKLLWFWSTTLGAWFVCIQPWPWVPCGGEILPSPPWQGIS